MTRISKKGWITLDSKLLKLVCRNPSHFGLLEDSRFSFFPTAIVQPGSLLCNKFEGYSTCSQVTFASFQATTDRKAVSKTQHLFIWSFTSNCDPESSFTSNLTILKSYSTSNKYCNQKLTKLVMPQNLLPQSSTCGLLCSNSSKGEDSRAHPNARPHGIRSRISWVGSQANLSGFPFLLR